MTTVKVLLNYSLLERARTQEFHYITMCSLLILAESFDDIFSILIHASSQVWP